MNFYLKLLAFIMIALMGQAADRPNFVYFIADDISMEDLGCYGHKVIKTPNIDKLASNGMRFTNAYLTSSSCSVSRNSIITGRYPHNNGAPELHTKLPKNQLPYPNLLVKEGYYTVLSGKNHMKEFGKETFAKVSPGKGPGKQEDWLSIVQKRPKDKPFFFWFSSYDAHHNWVINDKAPVYKPEDVIIPPYMYDAPKIRKELAGYYHEVSRFDYYVGEIVAELKKQNVLDNTLIITMADNGRPFTRAKTRVYDSGIKTPFIVHYPQIIKDPSVSKSIISAIDVSATVLEVAGIKKPDSIQGVSFLPVLKDPKIETRNIAFAEHNWHVFQSHERMVRMGDFLYIKNNYPNRRLWSMEALSFTKEMEKAFKEGQLNEHQKNVFRNPCPEEELFHVGKDPDQLTNLAINPEYKEVLKQMRKQLEAWTLETGDTVPKNPTPDRGTPGTKGRNPHREFPGQSAGATKINKPGPVKLETVPRGK